MYDDNYVEQDEKGFRDETVRADFNGIGCFAIVIIAAVLVCVITSVIGKLI